MNLINSELLPQEWLKLFENLECKTKVSCWFENQPFEACIYWSKTNGLLLDVRCWKCGKYLLRRGSLSNPQDIWEFWREETHKVWFKINKNEVVMCDPGIYGNRQRLNKEIK